MKLIILLITVLLLVVITAMLLTKVSDKPTNRISVSVVGDEFGNKLFTSSAINGEPMPAKIYWASTKQTTVYTDDTKAAKAFIDWENTHIKQQNGNTR